MRVVALRRYPVKSMGGEETRVGRTVRVGTAELTVVATSPRCRMIDIAQDGVEPGTPWLRALGAERDLALGIYADVRVPGAIRTGDLVKLGEPGRAARRSPK